MLEPATAASGRCQLVLQQTIRSPQSDRLLCQTSTQGVHKITSFICLQIPFSKSTLYMQQNKAGSYWQRITSIQLCSSFNSEPWRDAPLPQVNPLSPHCS